MKYLAFTFLVLLLIGSSERSSKESTRTIAGSLIKINSLGSSYKGKYVAVEEYGYSSNKAPYARIRVIDVWKDRQMEDIEIDASKSNLTLNQLRERNRSEAREKVKKYKIFF